MINVLFVCLGNICRSPMAESVFREVVRKRGYSGSFNIDSAGTAGYHIGKQPDRRTLEVLETHGLKTTHRGQKIDDELLSESDHIAVMDEANFEDVHNYLHKKLKRPPAPEKLFLIRDFDPEVRGVHEVPDPYYEPIEAFEGVYTLLERSSEALLDHLIDLHQLEPDPERDEEE
ncbi:low molecular weight protein-tyrosine-phosphatase [Jiulongibacter sediminis]|uniref:low molecular weight protein-tyrosine-phosphatase n=1 Tax=Jiulongibacter sediminis TaxID=1605367 RepID=UPI0026EF5782|nr:low molecular weight protein-tyrosine-phosphatase [Jiulongibacter sediminis]